MGNTNQKLAKRESNNIKPNFPPTDPALIQERIYTWHKTKFHVGLLGYCEGM